MNITAREYYRKSSLIPLLSWKVDSLTTFGDHEVMFDLPREQVLRSMDGSSEAIARIHHGYKGARLPEFFGTVESDAFIVTKRKQDWSTCISGNVIFEITLKACGLTVTNLVLRADLYHPFEVADVLRLNLLFDDHLNGLKIEGTCVEDYRDLAEIVACLLLHHNELKSGPD